MKPIKIHAKPEKRIETDPPDRLVRGVVIARKCPHCNHHEIGVTTEAGEFVALRPGMKIDLVTYDPV